MPVMKEIPAEVTGHVPVKIWTDQIEESAEQQLTALAGSPYVFHHVAAMPDVHYGLGATIGSVFATRDALLPTAVGVDIGCFTGDTLIPLLNGKDVPIKELAESGDEFWVWSVTPSQRITSARATARRTRGNASLVRVTLDNGKSVTCTPDHQFMLRDGSWLEAANLQPGASLMPLYTKTDRDGYVMVSQPYSGRWQRAHWAIARTGVLGKIPRYKGQRVIIHHKDFDQTNNDPANLEFMGDRDHSSFHRLLSERNEHWNSAEFKRRRYEVIRRKIEGDPDFLAKKVAVGTENILRYMQERSDEFRAAVAGNGQRGKEYLLAYNTSEKGRAKSREVGQQVGQEVGSRHHVCPHCGAEGRSNFFISRHINRCKKAPNNHRVVSVEALDWREDVYCLTVPTWGNFALSAGVFVHNCGVLAQPFEVRAVDLSASFLRELHERTKARIPTGFGQHARAERWEGFEDERGYTRPVASIVREKGPVQLGSLGGGNHFLELCRDEEGLVWLMLHSGSRGAGNLIATYHIERARALNERLGIQSARDLWVLPLDRPEGRDYLTDMLWAQDYAMENRQRMRWAFVDLFADLLKKRLRIDLRFDPDAAVNIHHNYANRETAYGVEVWVHRKGATFAGEGVLGIIPGSMATGSYIVRGLGNPESFQSCSHGAGRVMSRGEAVRSITLESFAKKMQGIVAETGKEYVDEAPQAYKDLDTVILNQADLVEPVRRLWPLMNVKGAGKVKKDRTRDKEDPTQRRKLEARKRR